jgi:hypothetical protein
VRACLTVVALVLLVSSPASAQFKIAANSASSAADAVVDRLDAGSGPGTLVIFGSACPADADTADSGTTLAVLTFSDPAFGAATGGTATANAITADSSANATGTAMCFRAKDSDGNVIFQGAITTTGGGGDIILNSTSITSGQSVSITVLTYTQPTLVASGHYLRWEHTGTLVNGFILDVDGEEYDLGALTPITGTTYETTVPVASVTSGEHTIIVYAENADGRTASTPLVVTW